MAINDVGFPVARVLDGIDAAAAAGLAPVKVNMVVKRGVNEQSILPMAEHSAAQRARAAVHRVHGRRHHQWLAARRGRPRRGDRLR